jgi:hypothetical protein
LIKRGTTKKEAWNSASKMRAAAEALDRRLGMTWERQRLARVKNVPGCRVRLDRLEVTTSVFERDLILDIPGFRRTSDGLVRRRHPAAFLSYRRLCILTGPRSVRQIHIFYEATMRRLAPRKIALIARDESGLEWTDVRSVLEILPNVRLVMAELGFDFGFASGVDGEYVRAHALFGKSRKKNVAALCGWDSWGSRRGTKFVRSYYKEELGVRRVELQLNRGFLLRHGIRDVFDFEKLVNILPRHHLLFARLDEARALQQLTNVGHGAGGINRILEMVRLLDGDLLAQLSVLRKRGRLINARRVLVPLKKNQLVKDALREWAATWPKAPIRLGERIQKSKRKRAGKNSSVKLVNMCAEEAAIHRESGTGGRKPLGKDGHAKT